MNDENETRNMTVIQTLLRESGRITGSADLIITALAGDGSSRKFWRIMQGDSRVCLAVAPPTADQMNLAEAKAARAIGLHLLKQGVRVPEQYGWNEKFGVLLFEDFGDTKLHDYVLKRQSSENNSVAIRSIYSLIVQNLAKMQVNGARGFDTDWCWDTPRYDKSIMLERESGYFLRAFWQDSLGKKEPSGLQEEFAYLAERAALIPADYFLHRDFQSRNIMLHRGKPCFIDFQGGRLGPLAYDLASLLIDPYVALQYDFQEELIEEYLDTLEALIVVDRKKFVEEYLLLALQRNLQIVGAFAFLSKQRKKVFFEQFLKPAIDSLNTLLDCKLFSALKILRHTASSAAIHCRPKKEL
ncbi:MAG TPA: aminoglycoside phosphotransferase [Desulfocapsa sulfexigens]|nr:aminoglycoside phosphotransferase [Desulfocapsa sulfexigens]